MLPRLVALALAATLLAPLAGADARDAVREWCAQQARGMSKHSHDGDPIILVLQPEQRCAQAVPNRSMPGTPEPDRGIPDLGGVTRPPRRTAESLAEAVVPAVVEDGKSREAQVMTASEMHAADARAHAERADALAREALDAETGRAEEAGNAAPGTAASTASGTTEDATQGTRVADHAPPAPSAPEPPEAPRDLPGLPSTPPPTVEAPTARLPDAPPVLESETTAPAAPEGAAIPIPEGVSIVESGTTAPPPRPASAVRAPDPRASTPGEPASASARGIAPEGAGIPLPERSAANAAATDATLPLTGPALAVALGALAAAAATLLAWALYSRIDPADLLRDPRRAQLHARLRETRGITAEALAEEFRLHPSTVAYHLRRLERAGLARRHPSGAGDYWTLPSERPDVAALDAKRVPVARALHAAVAREPGRTTLEVARTAGASRRLALYHLRRMQAAGVVRAGGDDPGQPRWFPAA